MLFLEDLYAQRRTTAQDWRTLASQHHYHPGSPRQNRQSVDLKITNSPPSAPPERNDRSAKRNSLWSRRRSTATNSSIDSQKRNSAVGGGSRRSSLADMAVTENDTLKSKLLFGLATTKKNGGRKSDPTDVEGEGEGPRTHHRGSSVDSNDQISFISAPFGFQHIARIERSPRPDGEASFAQMPVSPGTVPPSILSPPRELQSSLARRTNKRPPPLRPKRPEDSLIPHDLLSPHNVNMHSLRHFHSVEGLEPPRTAPTRPPPMPPCLSPDYGPAPIPPRRSSKRLPPHLRDQNRLAPVQSAPQTFFRDSLTQDDFDNFPPHLDPQHGINRRDLGPLYQALELVQYHRPQLSPHFNAPLEQVPEEPEGTASPGHRDMKRQPSLRHAKSSPNMSRSNSKTMLPRIIDEPPPRFAELPPIRVERPASQGSDTLGDLNRRSFSISKESDGFVERSVIRDTAGSWEDDIEFCYNHAAEANCDFDWSNVSKFLDSDSTSSEEDVFGNPSHSDHNSRKPRTSAQSHQGEILDLRDKSFLHQSFISGPDSIPELDYRSAYTGSTNSLAVGTPQDRHRFPSIEGLRQSTNNNQRNKAGELLGITIPQAPTPRTGNRLDLDSDLLYDDLMGPYKSKEIESQSNQPLLMLEPKVYSRETSPMLTQRPPLRGKPYQSPTSAPAPTSTPMTYSERESDYVADSPAPNSQTIGSERRISPITPITPLATSLTKDLPPLPATSPNKPAPLSLTVDSIVAQLRSPNESPTAEAGRAPYTPPASNHSSPPMPDFKSSKTAVRRKPMPQGALLPNTISRNASEHTVVTTMVAAPPSPPESPDIPQLQLAQNNSASTPLSRVPVSASRIPVPSAKPDSLNSSPGRPSPMRKQPSMPIMRSTSQRSVQKRVEFKTTDVVKSPIARSPSSTSSENSSRASYTLFPSGSSVPATTTRPTGRPRRSTAA